MYKHQRKPNRLKDFDYSSEGAYSITICVKQRACLLSEIEWEEPINSVLGVPSSVDILNAKAKVVLTDWGEIVDTAIKNIPAKYPGVHIDNYVIMPNHIHMIISIEITEEKGRAMHAPTISRIIQQMKGYVTKQIGVSIWQKLFHDHIIRDQEDYNARYEYINRNPTEWKFDDYYFEQCIM